MDPSLRNGPPVVEVLKNSIGQNLRTLRHELAGGSGKPKAKRVHAIRTCARRLLAALELTGTLGAPPTPHTLRSLRRLLSALSPLRDSQVQLRALQEMTDKGGDVSALSARLEKKKRELAREATQELARFDVDRFEQELGTVAQKLAADVAATSDGNAARTAVQGDLARRHLEVTRRKWRVTVEDPRSLHRLRLALKSYRYGLAAVAPAMAEAGRELSEAVTRLQDHLGTAHDAHVLARTAAAAKKSGQRKSVKRLSGVLARASRDAQRDAVEAVNSAKLAWPFHDGSGSRLESA